MPKVFETIMNNLKIGDKVKIISNNRFNKLLGIVRGFSGNEIKVNFNYGTIYFEETEFFHYKCVRKIMKCPEYLEYLINTI